MYKIDKRGGGPKIVLYDGPNETVLKKLKATTFQNDLSKFSKIEFFGKS